MTLQNFTRKDIEALLQQPFEDLLYQAGKIQKQHFHQPLDLCTIMNARSGLCSEDCQFCAQSCHHRTHISTYPLASKDEIIKAAQRAKDIGSGRFGIVTSGNNLTPDEKKRIIEAISAVKEAVNIEVCASLGQLDKETLVQFKQAGLSRYHHNIETSPQFYPNIVSTHSFTERVTTIRHAKQAGLFVCSGGILGLGERWDDRIEMILALQELDVDSIPLNVLVPILGTPLENAPPISPMDVIKTIALFRIVFPKKIIKLAAGRETVLKDFQALALLAGANGMLIGGYLTINGRDIKEDWKLIAEINQVYLN